jgi:hypothetical protein
VTAKSASIKDAERKFGDCAWKAEKLTSGDLSSCPEFETGRIARFSDRTAEVSRGRSMRRRLVERDTRPKGEKQLVLNENRDNREGPNGPHLGLNGGAFKA